MNAAKIETAQNRRLVRKSSLVALLTIGTVIAGLIAAWALLPIGQWIVALQTWVETQGLLGHVVFALIYAAATVALAPGAPLTLAAGVAFGLNGFPTTVLGATLGAGLAFLAGRYLARGWVERLVASKPALQAVDRAIATDGWKIVGLVRLSPLIPFNLQNYFFGVTPVGFWPYLLTTFFGIMPGTLLYVWIGSLGASAGAGLSGGGQDVGTIKTLALVAGLAATVAVTVLVSWKANQLLKKAGVEAGKQPINQALS